MRRPLDVLAVATGSTTDDAGHSLSSFRPGAHRVVIAVTDAPTPLTVPGREAMDAGDRDVDRVASAVRGVTYLEVSDAPSGLETEPDGDGPAPVGVAVGGTWFERPDSSATAFTRLVTGEIAPRVARTYTATFRSTRGRDGLPGSIRVVVDDPGEGSLDGTWEPDRPR